MNTQPRAWREGLKYARSAENGCRNEVSWAEQKPPQTCQGIGDGDAQSLQAEVDGLFLQGVWERDTERKKSRVWNQHSRKISPVIQSQYQELRKKKKSGQLSEKTSLYTLIFFPPKVAAVELNFSYPLSLTLKVPQWWNRFIPSPVFFTRPSPKLLRALLRTGMGGSWAHEKSQWDIYIQSLEGLSF